MHSIRYPYQSRESFDPSSSTNSSKGPRLLKSDKKWDLVKHDVRRIYMVCNRTLQETMAETERIHGLQASVRKWKTKLKEWNFEKYLSNRNMNIIVAKGKKRALEEGKDTIFVYHGSTIPASKIQNYSKRSKVARNSDSAPPCSAATPDGVTYNTPSSEQNQPDEDNTKGDDNDLTQHGYIGTGSKYTEIKGEGDALAEEFEALKAVTDAGGLVERFVTDVSGNYVCENGIPVSEIFAKDSTGSYGWRLSDCLTQSPEDELLHEILTESQGRTEAFGLHRYFSLSAKSITIEEEAIFSNYRKQGNSLDNIPPESQKWNDPASGSMEGIMPYSSSSKMLSIFEPWIKIYNIITETKHDTPAPTRTSDQGHRSRISNSSFPDQCPNSSNSPSSFSSVNLLGNFSCCGKTLPTLIQLLDHYKNAHAHETLFCLFGSNNITHNWPANSRRALEVLADRLT